MGLHYVYISVLWGPAFSIHPRSTSEFIDDGIAVVTLFCKANGFPRPVIGWLQNNTPVTSGKVSQNGSISSLVIVFNETTDKPINYRCIARNSQGSTLSEEATLTVAKRQGGGRFQRVRYFMTLTTNNTNTSTLTRSYPILCTLQRSLWNTYTHYIKIHRTIHYGSL